MVYWSDYRNLYASLFIKLFYFKNINQTDFSVKKEELYIFNCYLNKSNVNSTN